MEEYCSLGKVENLKEYIDKKKLEFAENEPQNLPDMMVINEDFTPIKSRMLSFDDKDKFLYGTSILLGCPRVEIIVLTKQDYIQTVDL